MALDAMTEHPFGRVKVRNIFAERQLSFHHLLDRQETLAVDIANEPGDIMTFDAACVTLGVDMRTLKILMAHGVLNKIGCDQVRVPTGETLRSLYRKWLALNPPRPTRKGLLRVTEVQSACGLSHDEIPADSVLSSAAEYITRILGTFRRDEFTAFMQLKPATARKALNRLSVLEGRSAPDVSTALRHQPLSIDEIVKLTPELAGAPETCLDPEPFEHYEEPGERSRARLAGTGPLLASTSFFVIVAAASNRREERLEHHMLMVQRFSEKLSCWHPGSDHTDGAAITDTLERIAFSEDGDVIYCSGVRDMICRTVLMMHDVVARYANAVDPKGVKGLQALVPSTHAKASNFRQKLRDEFRKDRLEARERRKERSDPLADNLSDVTSRFWARMDQLAIIAENARAAGELLLDPKRNVAEPFEEFLVTIPVLHDNGRYLTEDDEGNLQEERWRVWKENDLRRSLGMPARMESKQYNLPIGGVDFVSGRRNDATAAFQPSAGEAKPRLLFERMGARTVVGSRVVQPFFVTLSEKGVMAKPRSLDKRLANKRLTVLRTWRAPPPSSLPRGLMWFDDEGEKIWRNAARKRRSIIPLMEFETGSLFAELGCNAVLESMCRGGAFLQMEDNQDAWPTDDSGYTHAGLCFAAIEKTPAGNDPTFVNLPVLDQTFLDAKELIRRVSAAAGNETGEVPDVLIEKRARWKRPHPRPYVFQWNGRALTLTEVTYMLKLLFANIEDVTFHDFRHACAAVLFDSCRCPEILKRALGQTSGIWRYYARLTNRMKQRDRERQENERQIERANQDWARKDAP